MNSIDKPVINRLEAVLAEQLDKDQATVSKWCTNTAQHGLETLMRIAECLDIDMRELIVRTK